MLPGRRCRPTREGLGSGEELVHDLGAGGDDGSWFASVDDLGRADGGVPGQAGDLLDADSLVAHQADEGGAQLARGPAVPDASLGADAAGGAGWRPGRRPGRRGRMGQDPASCAGQAQISHRIKVAVAVTI
jgi:hypothetical protein